MTRQTQPSGWLCFNTSNEEWEWCASERPQECEGATNIEECTYREFCERFPNHD